MDAEACRRCTPKRTVKPCGPVPPMQGTSCEMILAATVAKAGSPGRSRSSRKTIAQGVPDDFGVPVLACVRRFDLHARQWVRHAPGIPCTLCFSRATKAQPGHFVPRECEPFSGGPELCALGLGSHRAQSDRARPCSRLKPALPSFCIRSTATTERRPAPTKETYAADPALLSPHPHCYRPPLRTRKKRHEGTRG